MNEKQQQALTIVSNTEAGSILLKYLMDELCGYQKPSLVLIPGAHDASKDMMMWNEARRDIWLTLRSGISADRLAHIELNREPVEPFQAQGDLNVIRGSSSDTSGDSSSATTTESGSTGGSGGYRHRNIQAESDAYTRQYLESLGYTPDGNRAAVG